MPRYFRGFIVVVALVAICFGLIVSARNNERGRLELEKLRSLPPDSIVYAVVREVHRGASHDHDTPEASYSVSDSDLLEALRLALVTTIDWKPNHPVSAEEYEVRFTLRDGLAHVLRANFVFRTDREAQIYGGEHWEYRVRSVEVGDWIRAVIDSSDE